MSHGTANEDHALIGDVASVLDDWSCRFGRPDDDLGHAVAVAEVDKDGPAVVAFAVDPSAQGDFGLDIIFAELAAGMGT